MLTTLEMTMKIIIHNQAIYSALLKPMEKRIYYLTIQQLK